jgi:hypothetical protein
MKTEPPAQIKSPKPTMSMNTKDEDHGKLAGLPVHWGPPERAEAHTGEPRLKKAVAATTTNAIP